MRATQYKFFEDYSLEVKRALEKIIFLEHNRDEDHVDVVYATPPLAFAKFLHGVKNGQQPGPNVNFYLENIQYAETENLLGFTNTLINSQYIHPPQIYKLEYKVIMFTNNESDGDIIMAQILMGMPFNRPYVGKVNNQWATIHASNPINDTAVEAGEGKDKISRRSLSITVDRAYIDYPIKEVRRFIKDMNISYSIEEAR